MRAELVAFAGLMAFLRSDWARPWLPGVHIVDASLSGIGVSYGQWPLADAEEVGRVPERARYRLGAGPARASAALAAGLDIGSESGKMEAPEADSAALDPLETGRWELCPRFPEVPARLLQSGIWRLVQAGRWTLEEGILHLEARATLQAVRRLTRSRAGRDAQAIVLGDNLAVVQSFARHWSRYLDFLVQIRKVAALNRIRFCFAKMPDGFPF